MADDRDQSTLFNLSEYYKPVAKETYAICEGCGNRFLQKYEEQLCCSRKCEERVLGLELF